MRVIGRNISIEHYFTITLDRKGMSGEGEVVFSRAAKYTQQEQHSGSYKAPEKCGVGCGAWGVKINTVL
jgi:hypothetical protein